MELVVDEFVIEWFAEGDERRQVVESIVRLINRRCHRLVFDRSYLDKLARKLRSKIDMWKNTYMTIMLMRLKSIIYNPAKARVCNGPSVPELKDIPEQDRPIVKSALCIFNESKLLVTTNSDLLSKADVLKKYGIKMVTPDHAEEIISCSHVAIDL